MKFNPATTALLIIDMQNGFCHPDGSLYSPNSEAAISPITELITTAREAGVNIIFTRDVHPPEQFEQTTYYDEFDRWGEHVLEDSWDAEIVEELPVKETDKIVEKHTYDAFYQTELDGWLSAHNITDLLICGTLANVCVLHTAGSAGLRDYRPVLVKDAVGYIEEDHRDYALNHADWLFGETIDRSMIDFATPTPAD